MLLARPARLERATCGFVGKTSELPNLLKFKEVFEMTEFYVFQFFLILARFSIFWKVFHTQSPTWNHPEIPCLPFVTEVLQRAFLLTLV